MDTTNKQLKGILAQLKLPRHFSFSEFVEHVQVYTSKQINFIPWPLPSKITGACLPSDSAYYIFYPEGTTPALQTIIKLHEMVHIVLGHKNSELSREEEKLILNTILGTNTSYEEDVKGLVMRSLTDSERESEVESLARKLLKRLRRERSGGERSLAIMDMD